MTLSDKIRSGAQLEPKERDIILNLIAALADSAPEKTGHPFICGKGGQNGPDGLPETLLVCPSYGLSGFAVYRKDRDYSEPGH